MLAGGAQRERLQGITQALHGVFQSHPTEHRCVLANVPPAWVHHVRIAPAAPPLEPPDPAQSAALRRALGLHPERPLLLYPGEILRLDGDREVAIACEQGELWLTAGFDVPNADSGINASSAAYRATPFGTGLRCDGAQAMTAPNAKMNFSANSEFTFEAWINPDTVAGTQILGGLGSVSLAGNWLVRINNSKLFFTNDTGGGFSTLPGAVSAGVWQHVAMAARGPKISFYVNGVLLESGVSSPYGNAGSYGQLFALCAAINTSAVYENPYQGLMDEVRILNYVASAEQIAADYAATAPGIFSVEYSTTGGNTWAAVSDTTPAAGYAYLSFPGAEGGLGPDALVLRDMTLAHSTNSSAGAAAPNQV
ncbi:MAG: LamG domain-containing protein, partial [Elusimicrobiota bacterium]